MTRASLLHILDHVSAISEAEVRELEQLAAAFPYCQTAHVLLAKAAHDTGSMLAGQRLRRAATYAADRQLLRQLIEQPAPAAVLVSATEDSATAVEVPAEPLALPAPEAPAATPLLLPEATLPAEAPAAAEAPATEELAPTPTPSAEAAPFTAQPEAAQQPEPVATESVDFVEVVTEVPESAELPGAVAEEVDASLPVTIQPQAETIPALPAPTPEPEPEAAEPSADEAVEPRREEADEPALLPAVAPPIRPPAEAGTSRFEFGLSSGAAAELAVYELPAAAEPAVAPATPTTPPFYADEELGYAPSYGSRLGSCLQLHNELTRDLPATTFFAPDALLLAHVADQQPPAVPAPSSLAIIERFLQNQPRLKAPTPAPPAADEQADLSAPSTSVTPALASESLAKIMVRQGKKAKAIEIYEHLMMRQPEKKAYFAAQIDQLKRSE